MPTIKKIGNIVFTILNTVLIISLLLFSTVLILSVNSNSPTIMGFSSKLIFDRNDESAMLVISRTSAQLAENDEFVYIALDGVGIYIADHVDANTITYRGLDNSIISSISTLAPEYGGKVLIKNDEIGTILATLVKTESMAVVYVLIIGTFSLLLLLLFLVHYLFKNKDRLVEYYEEVEEEVVDQNGQALQPAPLTMAESFEDFSDISISRSKKSKSKKKKSKDDKDEDYVTDLIDGIGKNPNNSSVTKPPVQSDKRNNLETPLNTRTKRRATPKSVAMPPSNFGDDVETYEFEITEDTNSIDSDAFLSQSTLNSMYSEDDILAVLTEPNATFVVEDDEDDDYYEDGNVKYFSNGTQRPSLQESLIAYVHTNLDVDPEPPLPLAKTSEGIPIEWFESILEVANDDSRLPEVLLEDFEIKPVQVEEPVVNTRDLIEKVEEMSSPKTKGKGQFSVVSNTGDGSNHFEEVQSVRVEEEVVNVKPSADSLLQEIDSIFQKPEPTVYEEPEPTVYEEPVTPPQSTEESEFLPEELENNVDNDKEVVNEETILNEMKEQYG